MALTLKQEQFCREYIVDLNGTQAAIRAGYSEKTANEQAARLLTNVSVKEYVQSLMDKRSARVDITADYVLNGIRDTIEAAKKTDDHSPALKGYELLGKHLKLFTEKHEVTGKDGGAIETRELSSTDSWIAGLLPEGENAPHKKLITH